MWSPEGRKQSAHELRQIADKVPRYRQLCNCFAGYLQPEVSYVAHPEPR